MLLALPR